METWNQWRKEQTHIEPHLGFAELSGAELSGADFSKADLSAAELSGANLSDSNLSEADLNNAILSDANLSRADLWKAKLSDVDLSGADLSGANLSQADLSGANLNGARLFEADLSGANLNGADFSGADLSKADLSRAILVGTSFVEATLTNCNIYGIAAWNVELKGARQNNLVITPFREPTITVDNLEVAQFIYLILNNQKIREVIDTITSKVVLILGRFTVERNVVLNTLKEKLREHKYLPVLFDFDKPASQTMMETIRTLAHLARFMIVDLTDPRSVPAELAMIVPHCLVPVQPLLETSAVVGEENVTEKHVVERNRVKGKEYALFRSLQMYPWVLPVVHYQDTIELFSSFKERIIDPAEQKAQELAQQK